VPTNTLYTHPDKNVVCNGPAGWVEYGKESIRSGGDCSSAWQGHFTANTGIGNREAYIFKLFRLLSSVTRVLKASSVLWKQLFRTLQPCLYIKALFFYQSMHQWVVLQNGVKIYIKTAPTYFGVSVTPSSGSALTLILLTWRICWAPNNAMEWHMGFNSAFKGLTCAY